MNRFVIRLTFFAVFVTSLYAFRHFFIGTILEFVIERKTGQSIHYKDRSWKEGKLVYDGFTLGNHFQADRATFGCCLTFSPFLIEPRISLKSPVINFEEKTDNTLLAFLIPTKHLKIRLDMKEGSLVTPDGRFYCFDFISSDHDIGELKTPLFSCRFSEDLFFDLRIEKASLESLAYLVDLFYSLPDWKRLDGFLTAHFKGAIETKVVRGDFHLEEGRFESDDMIVALDSGKGEIDGQSLSSQFEGFDFFWKELEVIGGKGILQLLPNEAPLLEAEAMINIAEVEGIAKIRGHGQPESFDGTLDYQTSSAEPLKLDFSWGSSDQERLLQAEVHHMGKEILAFLAKPFVAIEQGSLQGKITAFIDGFTCHRLEVESLSIQNLVSNVAAFDQMAGNVILVNDNGWGVEESNLTVLNGFSPRWELTDISANITMREGLFEATSALGKWRTIPLEICLEGPLPTFHAHAKLTGCGQALNMTEPSVDLELQIDRNESGYLIDGAFSCLEDRVALHIDFDGHSFKGDFQSDRLRSQTYTPFLAHYAPTLLLEGNLTIEGHFTNELLETTIIGENIVAQLSNAVFTIPGHTAPVIYHYNFRAKQGGGNGKISPMVVHALEKKIHVKSGDFVFNDQSWICHHVEGDLNQVHFNVQELQGTSEGVTGIENLRGEWHHSSGETIGFFADLHKQKLWNFSTQFFHQGHEVLALAGETDGRHFSITHEKDPVTFELDSKGKVSFAKGAIHLDIPRLTNQLQLAERLELITLHPKAFDFLSAVKGEVDCDFNYRIDSSTFLLRGQDLTYQSTPIHYFQAKLENQGKGWTLTQCQMDDWRLNIHASEQADHWIVPLWQIDWQQLHLEGTALYKNGLFDFNCEGNVNTYRFHGKGESNFISFQNVEMDIDGLARLTCKNLLRTENKWESSAVNVTLFTPYAEVQAKLAVSLGKEITFQGPAIDSRFDIGKSSLVINQICGLFSDPYLNLKCTATLDGEALQCAWKLSKDHQWGGLMQLQKKDEILKIGLSKPMDWRTAKGAFLGLTFDLEKQNDVVKGKLGLKDSFYLAHFLNKEDLHGIGGFQFQGKWSKESGLQGELHGQESFIKEYQIQGIHAQIDYTHQRLRLKNLTVQDPAGSLLIKECQIDDSWHLTIPLIKGKDFRPSALRKRGETEKETKPFLIRNLVLTEVSGNLNDLQSVEGCGSFNFSQQVKKEPSFFDIPLGLLKDLGLDLFTPTMGECHFYLSNRRMILTRLENAFSEGKRSEFFLGEEPSTIDFQGRLFLNLRMKQSVVLKWMEPFMITVRGTVEKPKYSLR
jgi:hypothetical protein